MKKILAAVAATLTLAACGGPTAATYTANGFEVTPEDAEAVDLSGYSNDIAGLTALYEDYDAPNCEPGLAERDIANAYYLDCDSNADIRIHANAEAAEEAATLYAGNNPGSTVYRADNVTVVGTPGAVEAFIATFGGAK